MITKPVPMIIACLSLCITLIGAPSNQTSYEPTPIPSINIDGYVYEPTPIPEYFEDYCNYEEDEWQCDNRNCVFYWEICDGFDNCGDNSDEQYCDETADISADCGGDNFFQCKTTFGCIPLSFVCDFVEDCADGSDESAEAGCAVDGYQCKFDDGKLSHAELIAESKAFDDQLAIFESSNNNGTGGLTSAEVTEILQFANGFQTTGIDVQDNLVLVALLFMNVITVIFIILGLHRYDDRVGFDGKIEVSYITLLIIISQHLLITTLNLFTRPVVTCTQNTTETISWFDVMQYLISSTLWLIWLTYSYKGKCNKYCCGFFVIFLTFFIPLIVGISSDAGFYSSRYGGSGMVYLLSQLSMSGILALIVMKYPETMSWKCSKPLCSCCCECCQTAACCFCNSIFGFVIHLGCVTAFIFMILAAANQNTCLYIGGGMWFNPVWLVLNICLLFSSARYAVIMYNIIMLIITVMGSKYGTLCLYIINVQYSIHAILLPVYIIVIFFSIAPLSKWKFDLIQMYLVSFDVMTDIIVIYYFINTKDYIFAVLSASFIIIGQIFGTFSEMCGKDKMDHLTRGDKLLALFGFSGPWFIIKSWTDRKYALLEHKHQIWEIMFENMPGVALQIYAALTVESTGSDFFKTGALYASIFVSVVTISYSLWLYLVKFTNLSRELKNKSDLENGQSNAGLEDNTNPEIHPNGAAVELTVYGNAGPDTQTPDENEGDTKQTETETQNETNKDDGAQTQAKIEDAISLGVPEPNHQAIPSGSDVSDGNDEKAREIEEPPSENPEDDNNNSEDIQASEDKNEEDKDKDQDKDKDKETEKEDKIGVDDEEKAADEKVKPMTTNVKVEVDNDDEDENDYAQRKEEENVGKQKSNASTIDKAIGEDEQAYEAAMEKLKESKIVPGFIRNKFGDVIINRVLYSNLYFFMISDFYIRAMSIILFISLIPCDNGSKVCPARIGTGAFLFSTLLIFEFIMNKRMRIVEYQGFGFVFSIFAISILSSFYTVLSSLHVLREDKFFGKSVDFKDYMFEHKVRIYSSVLLNVINFGLLFAPGNSNGNNILKGVLILVFCFAVFINYYAINTIQKFVDPPNQYPFKLFGNKCGGNKPTTTKQKSPIVTEN